MRIERYYGSVAEESAYLSEDAIRLIENQDYAGFFTSCGPFYIRGIRRGQELASAFTFTSADGPNADAFTKAMRLSNWQDPGKVDNDPKFKQINDSLNIDIKAFGIGARSDGSETFLCNTIEEYLKVLKFSYNAMTKAKDPIGVGTVYGVELIHWSQNPSFQVASNSGSEVVIVPLERSLIPKAFRISNPADVTFDNTDDATRALFTCEKKDFEKDKFGYCCEKDHLYDFVNDLYDSTTPSSKVCRPLRELPSTVVIDNMVANGEFVARLDKAVKTKYRQISSLQNCATAVTLLPDEYDYNLLRTQPRVVDEDTLQLKVSVLELKLLLDPSKDFGLVKHLTREFDEYIEMFIEPCYAALYGSTSKSPEIVKSNFMASPWYKHEECIRLTCIATGMRWDRELGKGCVPGITLNSSQSYSNDDNCSKTVENGQLFCKHQTSILEAFQVTAHKCWSDGLGGRHTDFYLDNFCDPVLSNDKLTILEQQDLQQKAALHCNHGVYSNSVNVALEKPAFQSSTYPSQKPPNAAKYAVDGWVDGNYWRRISQHTDKQLNPWWSVDLGGTFTIKKIVVYNRQDNGADRLVGFKVQLLIDGLETWSWTHTSSTIEYKTEIPVDNNKQAKQVKISLPREDYLHLAEVEVYA